MNGGDLAEVYPRAASARVRRALETTGVLHFDGAVLCNGDALDRYLFGGVDEVVIVTHRYSAPPGHHSLTARLLTTASAARCAELRVLVSGTLDDVLRRSADV